MAPQKRGVLFVCLGNICRSPIAEAVFLHEIKERGIQDRWFADSAATYGFHTGKGPENRAMSTLKKFGVNDYKHAARVVSSPTLVIWELLLRTSDKDEFAFIFGMDDSNMRDIDEALGGCDGAAVIDSLALYDPQGLSHVPDPYYESGTARFEEVYHNVYGRVHVWYFGAGGSDSLYDLPFMSKVLQVYHQCVRCVKAFLDKHS